MKYLVLAAVAVLAGVTAVWGWFAWQYYDFHYRPPETPGREVTFEVRPGETFFQVAAHLEVAGLIKNRKYFVGMAQDQRLTTQVKAGEFLLNTGMLPDAVLKNLTGSAGILHRFTVREGLAWWETARLAEAAGLCSAADFEAAMHNPAVLERYHIPAQSAEGYLFPETYMISKALEHGARDLVEVMVKEFFIQARAVLGEPLPAPEALYRLVILASIVEKETGYSPERATIAGVYANRLKRPMRLQADPTVIYGLGPGFNGNLRTRDLADPNPYNTYECDGLPPGPICSPGAASLKAAAQPEIHNYLYFVAKGDGTHYFSKTLTEHNAAVVKYQRWGRNRTDYTSTKVK